MLHSMCVCVCVCVEMILHSIIHGVVSTMVMHMGTLSKTVTPITYWIHIGVGTGGGALGAAAPPIFYSLLYSPPNVGGHRWRMHVQARVRN